MKRYMRKALRASAVATPEIPDEKSTTYKKSGSNQVVHIKIPGKMEPQVIHIELTSKMKPVEFDLSALEHPFDLTPVLSLEDYNYLQELIRENGRVKAANLMPADVDDGIERTYRPYLFERCAAPGTGFHDYLVLHLFEVNGIEHVAYWYHGRPDGSWNWIAGRVCGDADTWEFDLNEEKRLFAAADVAVLRKQLSLQEANENG